MNDRLSPETGAPWLDAPTKLAVVVPSPTAALGGSWPVGLRRGSGIVADRPNPDTGQTVIRYEGFIYGQHADMDARARWERMVAVAAGRLSEDHPASARATVPTAVLVTVGYLDTATGRLQVFGETSLADWLAPEPARPVGR